jgi:sulfonate transport system substrate-binding protein
VASAGISDLGQLFASGQADAVSTIDPFLSDAEQRAGARLLSSEKGYVQNRYTYLATQKAVDDKGPAIAAFIGALAETLDWAKAHPEQQAALVAKRNGLPVASVRAGFDHASRKLDPQTAALVTEEQGLVDDLVGMGTIPSAVDVKPLFPPTFNAYTTGLPDGVTATTTDAG